MNVPINRFTATLLGFCHGWYLASWVSTPLLGFAFLFKPSNTLLYLIMACTATGVLSWLVYRFLLYKVFLKLESDRSKFMILK